MARPFLFGGSAQQAQSKFLVEFKAGKMLMKGKMVHPVAKKGTVYLNQTDDALIHFCWKDRTTGQTEDDLIIFPDDAEFKRVDACKDGRVYVLKFKSSSRRNFYWLQEPSEEKDEENCNKINEYLNNPPTPGSRSTAASGALGSLADIGSMNDSDLQNLLNNMTPQQMMQLLGGVGGLQSGGLAGLLGAGSSSTRQRGSNAAAAPPAAAPAAAPPAAAASTTSQSTRTSGSATASGSQPAAAIQLSDLQNIISGLTVPAGGAAAAPVAEPQNIDLSHSINYEALKPLLSNEQFMERVKEQLPPAVDAQGRTGAVTRDNASEQLAGTVSSPQFQQALSIFSAALQSGQLGPLIAQFSLGQGCVDAANRGDLEAFVKALDKNTDKKPGDKKDDDMALD